MLTIDRWRNWRPSEERFDESPGCEPPKPSKSAFEGFEGSTSEQVQNFSDRPSDEPEAWRPDFNRWMAANCIHREGRDDWGGIGFLHVDFCEWAVSNDSVPCQRGTFERLLLDDGFLCVDGMASGLVLRTDWQAHHRFQNPPAPAQGKQWRS